MSTEYGYGREEIVFVRKETSFGLHYLPLSANAVKILSSDFKMTQERMDRKEKGTTRSIVDRVTRKKSADWSISKYILPSGASGTRPDDHFLFSSAMGIETPDPGVKVVYSLAAEPSETLNVIRNVGIVRESVIGAVPNTMEISFGGGEEPKVTFSGIGKEVLTCGRDTLNGQATGTATITVNNSLQFDVGMFIKVGSEENFKINSINHVAKTMVLDRQVTDQPDASLVIPQPVTATTAGDIIPVIVGSIVLGVSGTVPVTAGTVTLNNNLEARNDEFGSDAITGYRFPKFREVTFSFDIYLRAADVKMINDAKRFTAQDLAIVLGGTAGKILTIDMNQCEFDIPPITIPEEGETTITISGKALGSTGEDELTLTFT